MKKLLITLLFIFLLSITVFSQKAKKVGEFGYVPCNQFSELMHSFYRFNEKALKYSDSKVVVIYYGTEYRKVEVPGFDGNPFYKTALPIRGDARNRALDISLYLVNEFRYPKARIELIDGGFREDFEFELWLVPRKAKNPQATPRIDAKTITYIDQEPTEPRNCSEKNRKNKKRAKTKPKTEVEDYTKAILFDEFGRIKCGDFLARMDALYTELDNNPYATIAIIYYGRRFWKEPFDWNRKTKEYEKIRVHYGHRDDGLNWAKAIPLYLIESYRYPKEFRDRQKATLKMINGGYRDKILIRVWLVPEGAELPKPTLDAFKAEEIKLMGKTPIRTPIIANCYSGY